MDECFNCGISEEKTKLFDAISAEGIAKVCEECAKNENIPLIKKPLGNTLPKKKRESVYARVSRMSGFDSRIKIPKKTESLKKQDTSLKEIIDKNYYNQISNEPKPDFLIDNFHWIIMRARRRKHLTQAQLAKEIKEPETAIKVIEKGIIPRGIYDLIKKLEKYLSIRIVKKEFKEKMESSEKKISFDPITTKSLTIEDLREMRKKEQEEIDEEPLFEDDWNFDEK